MRLSKKIVQSVWHLWSSRAPFHPHASIHFASNALPLSWNRRLSVQFVELRWLRDFSRKSMINYNKRSNNCTLKDSRSRRRFSKIKGSFSVIRWCLVSELAIYIKKLRKMKSSLDQATDTDGQHILSLMMSHWTNICGSLLKKFNLNFIQHFLILKELWTHHLVVCFNSNQLVGAHSISR